MAHIKDGEAPIGQSDKTCSFKTGVNRGCQFQAVSVVVDWSEVDQRLRARCVLHEGKIDNERTGEVLRSLSVDRFKEIH